MHRSLADYAKISLKGLAMGAADVVPGVSGGTIAFIAGIYEELINTIDQLDFSIFKSFRRNGFSKTWADYNLSFLLALLLGIGISILSFAKIISYLLKNEPIFIWSFFFGLVAASILYIFSQITKWSLAAIFLVIVGTIISYFITIAEPATSPDNYFYLFFSGFIAIIAMILPGVSGAFILLLLGSYHAVIGSINDLSTAALSMDKDLALTSLAKLGTVALGAILGIKLFSKILTWMFEHYKNLTLAVLTGFMIGSLNKLWPWKEVVSTYTNSHGEKVPILEENIWPGQFPGEPQVIEAIIFSILGFLTIFLLEKYAVSKKAKS